MKKLIPLIAICILLGCRETEIEKADGRNVQEEDMESFAAMQKWRSMAKKEAKEVLKMV